MPTEEKSRKTEAEAAQDPPVEVALAAKLLGQNAQAFLAVGAASGRFADILASVRAGMALAQADSLLLREVLMQNASLAQFFSSYGSMMRAMQEAMQAPLVLSKPQVSIPPSSVLRLQAPLAAVLRARDERVEKLEKRVAVLEQAVRELRELVDDPELPEEYKELVRKLLKDVQSQDYIR